MEPEHVTVHVDFKALIEKPHRVIWSFSQLAALGLTASAAYVADLAAGRREQATPGLPDALMHIAPNHVPTLETHETFQTWLIGCVLRDVIEVVSLFLEEVRQICAMYALLGPPDVAAEDWNATVIDEGSRFHRLGLPDKLGFIQTRYDVSLPSDFTNEVLTINRARNCLVHRNGLVTERDTDSTGSLIVKWRCLEVRARDESGERVATKGMRLKRGTAVGVVLNVHEKTFKQGERLAFTTQELTEICTSLIFFTREFGLATERWANAQKTPSSS